MHIVLVEDDARLARSYQRQLEAAGHRVEVFGAAEPAQARAQHAAPGDIHVIILDVMLPGRSGIALCRDLRAAGNTTPILLLTALDQTEDKVAGLDAGADDYLTKPFPMEELLARLRALVRRPQSFEPEAGATQLRLGELVIDQLEHDVYWRKQLVPLTPSEYALLEYLARNADRVLTRQQLLQRLWPDGTEAGSNVLETYIHHLRAKLETHGETQLIQTVRGVGYVLRTPRAGGAP
jgi:DNA-binding response OmpR family regulator